VIEKLKLEAVSLLMQLGMALIIWMVGMFIIKKLERLLELAMEKKKVDSSLKSFTSSLFSSAMYLILVIIVISTLGFQTSSLVAIIGAAGLAIGLALQGSLSNFASGILIIIFRPFGVGDFVEAGSFKGTVKEIQIFSTIMDTPDNKRIIIPNSQLSNNAIINYTKNDIRRVDFVFSVSYDDNLKIAREIITNILSSHEKVLKDKDIFVKISEYADSSINFAGRVWVKKEDYWDVYFDVMEIMKEEYDKAGLNIPYPQMDIHMDGNK
jgi:small conductance mechanosensitive channel